MGKVVKTQLLCALRPCKGYTRQYSLVHWGGHASPSGIWSCGFVQGFHRKPVKWLCVASEAEEGKSPWAPGAVSLTDSLHFPILPLPGGGPTPAALALRLGPHPTLAQHCAPNL